MKSNPWPGYAYLNGYADHRGLWDGMNRERTHGLDYDDNDVDDDNDHYDDSMMLTIILMMTM